LFKEEREIAGLVVPLFRANKYLVHDAFLCKARKAVLV
jgi:hypothetical protein